MTNTPAQIKAALKQLKADYTETAQAEFKAGFAALFAQYPQLKSVSWTQYQPYFSDGNECTFSVNRDSLDINGFDAYDSDPSADNLHRRAERDEPDYDKDIAACIKAVDAFMDAFDDDTYKDLFDDHVQVSVTAKGIKTSTYQHD